MRFVLLLVVAAALAAPAASDAARRMPIGFQDDPAFRWSDSSAEQLAAAKRAHASVIRTIVRWSVVAPRRPARAGNSFDPAYHLGNLDTFVRSAAQSGFDVMITIWGTPRWANGGKQPNVAPTRASDLRAFAHALADRYSGRHAGYPYVGRYSVWNEPNLGMFLSPQFARRSKRIVSPQIYARLYRAAYEGIKAGNRHALVAIGETSNRGRNRPTTTASASVAPATFARLLAEQKRLRFDAYATHPYPTRPDLPPTQHVRWPNVTLSQLGRFERSLGAWFHRKRIPVWITEYGYQTKPQTPYGVTWRQQARYLSTVVRRLARDPNVHMLIWYVFRDSRTAAWKSGLVTQHGAEKRAYHTFSVLAHRVAGDTRRVMPGHRPTIAVTFPELAATASPRSTIRLLYTVRAHGRLVTSGSRTLRLRPTPSLVRLSFRPRPGKTYDVTILAADGEGGSERSAYALVAA